MNGVDLPIGVGTVTVFDTSSIKSVKQTGVTDFPDFSADSILEKFRLPSGVVKIDVLRQVLPLLLQSMVVLRVLE